MKNMFESVFVGLLLWTGCQPEPGNTTVLTPPIAAPAKTTVAKKVMADAATVLSRKEVPVLCYHNIKDFSASAGENTKVYTVKPVAFAEQMKTLAAAGYHTILPEQLYNYLVFDGPLPEKPIMITFDDTREAQFSIGAAEMKKYGFKGVFFIMTVSVNRPGYMSKEQIRSLSDDGHVIGANTWDHHMVTKYAGDDWNTQLVKPKIQLEEITGKPVTDFAYPFGVWNTEAIAEIKKRDYKMAYILSTKRDAADPLYTVRRMTVSGTWSAKGVMNAVHATFH